jgi:hypothetical protein
VRETSQAWRRQVKKAEFDALEELFDAIEEEGPGDKSPRLQDALERAHFFVEKRKRKRSEAA